MPCKTLPSAMHSGTNSAPWPTMAWATRSQPWSICAGPFPWILTTWNISRPCLCWKTAAPPIAAPQAITAASPPWVLPAPDFACVISCRCSAVPAASSGAADHIDIPSTVCYNPGRQFDNPLCGISGAEPGMLNKITGCESRTVPPLYAQRLLLSTKVGHW